MSTSLLSIHLPVLPDKDLLTNARDGRLHWSERARAVRKLKRDWEIVLTPVLRSARFRQGNDGPRLFLVWTLYVSSYKSPDVDGWVAALKPVLDVLCEMGLFWGDGPRYIGGSAYFVEVDKVRANRGTLDVWEYGAIKALLGQAHGAIADATPTTGMRRGE